MNLDTAGNPPKVVLDSNILISALVFGGKPQLILNLALIKKIIPIVSQSLITEFIEVLVKKFHFSKQRIEQVTNMLEDYFELVYPTFTIEAARDLDDNRVLEAAIEGKCDFIITGDKDLLDLKSYKTIQILTADKFLE